VGYTSCNTRQSIAVTADSTIATMEDFVIEHPCGLASYRIYEKEMSSLGKLEIVSGEAIDVAGGPTQDSMMWRNFVLLSHSIDSSGWDEKNPEKTECRELANVALETKRMILALVKSMLEKDCQEVALSSYSSAKPYSVNM
jgi:hypothetical protein